MVYSDIQIKVDIHDNVTGENASNTKTVYYGTIPPKIIADNLNPSEFNLEQNYPNPFNPITKINYAIPSPSRVNIKVYDLLGREIKELVNEQKDEGFYSINFDASNLSSGIYLYRIVVDCEGEIIFSSKRMVLIK